MLPRLSQSRLSSADATTWSATTRRSEVEWRARSMSLTELGKSKKNALVLVADPETEMMSSKSSKRGRRTSLQVIGGTIGSLIAGVGGRRDAPQPAGLPPRPADAPILLHLYGVDAPPPEGKSDGTFVVAWLQDDAGLPVGAPARWPRRAGLAPCWNSAREAARHSRTCRTTRTLPPALSHPPSPLPLVWRGADPRGGCRGRWRCTRRRARCASSCGRWARAARAC